MTTDTTREGFEIPGLLEMSDRLRARGIETKSFRDQSIAEAAWADGYQAAKADELAFLEPLERELDSSAGSIWLRIYNRVRELKGESRG